ncbi:hypothetical protein KM043_013851 [Ampulex compressa]|nr:hypothetical protein KM043_013851 [Ampulex compressa]
MLLTLLYVMATYMQARRFIYLQRRLCSGHKQHDVERLSIVIQMSALQRNTGPRNGRKPHTASELPEDSTSSYLCANSRNARIKDLLWYRNSAKVCTIYPKQEVVVSSWLTCEHGRTCFPLHANNHALLATSQEKVNILLEVDPSSYNPDFIMGANKVEDYGCITMWTINKSIALILETDMHSLTKLVLAALEPNCRVNDGLLLTRIQTVTVKGSPQSFKRDLLISETYANGSTRILNRTQWMEHIQQLRNLCNYVSLMPVDALKEEKQEKEITGDISVTIEELAKVINEEQLNSVQMEESGNVATESNEPLMKNNDQPVSTHPEKPTIAEAERNKFRRNFKPLTKTSVVLNELSKLLDVVIYAEGAEALNNLKVVLESTLDMNRYAICTLSLEEASSDIWMEHAALVVVCGNIGTEIGGQVVEYVIHGGKVLALCSDMLHTLLPPFKTAEVRENELVHFSYGQWKHVRMMHHIFCYQASPVRTRFSQDQDDVRITALHPPSRTEVIDRKGIAHFFDVKVLGTEETWHTPSILLASHFASGGKAIFSQIHLESDPMRYQLEESKYKALRESNAARLEIFKDLLHTHLGIEVGAPAQDSVVYSSAFFLGRHELKLEMLEKLGAAMQSNDILQLPNLEIQFCISSTIKCPASSTFLPVMVHQCPENFSTIEYFENLRTRELGRLVIYADVLTSSMDVVSGQRLQHGLAVIARQQTRGKGRGKNVWLSPIGAAMFTLQLHIPSNSHLARHVTVLQHLAAAAIVSAIRSLPGYEDIELNLKWPNDIYIGGKIKIGGILVTAQVERDMCVCSIGVGLNLSNKKPTSCLNDFIALYSQAHFVHLESISYERYFALVFNEMEVLLDMVQSGDIDRFLEIYYSLWLHTDTEVTVITAAGKSENARIIGIDEYGFLLFRNKGTTCSRIPYLGRKIILQAEHLKDRSLREGCMIL